MPVIRPIGIRFFVILSMALVPALALMLFNIWNEFSGEKQKIRDEAFLFAEKVVTQQQNKISYTKNILLNLANDPIAKTPAAPECPDFLQRILRINPLFVNLGIPLANGELLCNALPLQKAVNVADRHYFRNTIDHGSFAMSQFQEDRATGIASMNFSVPVYDNGTIIAAAVAVISLEWWGKQLTDNYFPEDGVAFIIDSDGQVIASHYGAVSIEAKDDLSSIFTDKLPTQAGVYEITSTENIHRLVAYTPMFTDDADYNAYVVVALPLESAFANAYAGLRLNLLTLLFSFTTLGLLLYWGLRIEIIIPIYKLLDTTTNFVTDYYKSSPQQAILVTDKVSRTGNELSLLSEHLDQVLIEQVNNQQELERLVYFDHLTQLPNRYSLLKKINYELAHNQDPFALVLIDLDNFKRINDRFGHDTGDMLLIDIANKLTTQCTADEIIGRWCGDEFICILHYHTQQQLEIRVKRILQLIAEPIQLGGVGHACPVRCGIALSQDSNDKDAGQLIRYADLAVAKAGEHVVNQINFFVPEMEKAGRERFELEVELRDAVNRSELCLHYQPIINLKTGQYELVEALVRWQHPTRGMVPPFEFIELAEKTGLIIGIGRWVVCEAIRQLALWHKGAALSINQVAVNLSPVQFQDPELIEIITSALVDHELEAQFLTLEITESVLLDGDDEALAKIAQFRAMGIKIALDDFGTGYSSLSYLSRIQLDKIKIDRSFVNEIGNARDEILIETIIAMSHSMNLSVVAEGIEELSQFEFLAINKCEYGQGYYFSKPLPAADIVTFIQNHQNEQLNITSN